MAAKGGLSEVKPVYNKSDAFSEGTAMLISTIPGPEKTFSKTGPDAVKRLEVEVNRWMKDMDDKIEVESLREFEDEDENGKVVVVVISYRYLPPQS